MEYSQEAIVSNHVIEFVSIANEFCSLLENTFDVENQSFIDKMTKILPMLYLKVMFLPKLEFISEELLEYSVSEEEWETINNDIAKILDDKNSYNEIYDPLEYDEKNDVSYISENMADIYQDIKNFLNQYHTGNTDAMNDAIVACVNNYENYWGQRTVNSLRVLHHLKY